MKPFLVCEDRSPDELNGLPMLVSVPGTTACGGRPTRHELASSRLDGTNGDLRLSYVYRCTECGHQRVWGCT
jgi:hypothetical protein